MNINQARLYLFVIVIILAACETKSIPSKKADVEESTKEENGIEYDTNEVTTILAAIAEANGGNERRSKLRNVSFDYYYIKPDGKKDISQERYIFKDEISWAKYTVHEQNVSPDLEGDIVQYYDGKQTLCYLNGEKIEDPAVLGVGQFLRQANFMWFNMMFKFTDPGIIASYEGKKEHNNVAYDVLKVSYDSSITGKTQNDTYILYVNPETYIVDFFNFSLPIIGVNEPVLWAELTYQEIDKMKVVVRRKLFGPSPETGQLTLIADQQLKNVSFYDPFTQEDLAADN